MADPTITFTLTDPDINALATLVELLDCIGTMGDEKITASAIGGYKVSVTIPVGLVDIPERWSEDYRDIDPDERDPRQPTPVGGSGAGGQITTWTASPDSAIVSGDVGGDGGR